MLVFQKVYVFTTRLRVRAGRFLLRRIIGHLNYHNLCKTVVSAVTGFATATKVAVVDATAIATSNADNTNVAAITTVD